MVLSNAVMSQSLHCTHCFGCLPQQWAQLSLNDITDVIVVFLETNIKISWDIGAVFLLLEMIIWWVWINRCNFASANIIFPMKDNIWNGVIVLIWSLNVVLILSWGSFNIQLCTSWNPWNLSFHHGLFHEKAWFSDMSRKCILPNANRAFPPWSNLVKCASASIRKWEIKHGGMANFMDFIMCIHIALSLHIVKGWFLSC